MPDLSKKPAELSKVRHLSEAETTVALSLRDDRFVECEEEDLLAARVTFVCSLMETSSWRGNRSVSDLCAVWGVSHHTVAKVAAESRRRLQAYIGSPDEFRGMLVAQLENIVSDAMNAEKAVIVKTGRDTSEVEFVKEPDRRAAINGISEMANLLGLKNKKEVKHTHNFEELDLDDLLSIWSEKKKKENSIDTTGTESDRPLISSHKFSGTNAPIPDDEDV